MTTGWLSPRDRKPRKAVDLTTGGDRLCRAISGVRGARNCHDVVTRQVRQGRTRWDNRRGENHRRQRLSASAGNSDGPHPLQCRSREPAAEYVFEVICDDDSVIAIKSQIVGAVTRPGFQLKSLRSFDTGTPNQVQVRAELSANSRDDNLLENAVSLFSAEPQVKAVRWSLQDEAAADWTGSGSG